MLSRNIFLLGWSVCLASCTYPNQPIQYTGSIHDVEALPFIEVAVDNDSIVRSLAIYTFTYGNKVKIDSKAVNPIIIKPTLNHLEYRSLEQNSSGASKWFIAWDHKKYGNRYTEVIYSGSPVYAINKKDFSIKLVPKKPE